MTEILLIGGPKHGHTVYADPAGQCLRYETPDGPATYKQREVIYHGRTWHVAVLLGLDGQQVAQFFLELIP